jgi:hypothetical protein
LQPVADFALASAIASAVLALPDVAALSAGPWGSVATHGPAGRIEGIRLLSGEEGLIAEVHVALHSFPIAAAADRARAAAMKAAAAAGSPLRRVDIYVEDVQAGFNQG